MTKVKNINGTSDNKCICGSWLQHCENYSNQTTHCCSEETCLEVTNLVGAHVQKFDSKDMIWYIIPLCKLHNKSTGEIKIVDGINFVAANKKETCGK